MMKGSDNAFCAGGDVYRLINEGLLFLQLKLMILSFHSCINFVLKLRRDSDEDKGISPVSSGNVQIIEFGRPLLIAAASLSETFLDKLPKTWCRKVFNMRL
ncbi:hypothetical protein Scep_009813 [Stephania cephalantha]|uniref:Uncharacterized protein n=1 Tax=Stephania cephalantha TaxID=152367 RepID=A0AAP0JWC1_9MAGN